MALNVDLSATPAIINAGDSFVLAWDIRGGVGPLAVTVDNGVGDGGGGSGSRTITLSAATMYTVTVTDLLGNVRTSSINVLVITGNQGTNAVIFSDAFSRANGAPGNGWTDQIGSLWSISSNQLDCVATNQGSGQPATADPLTQPLNADGRDVQLTYTLPANMFSVLASAILGVFRYNANGDLYLVDLEYTLGGALSLSLQGLLSTAKNPLVVSTAAINLAHSYKVTAVAFGINPTYLCAKVDDVTAGTTPIVLSAVVDSQSDVQQNGPFGLGASRSGPATLAFGSVSVSALELICAGELLSWPSVLGASVYKVYRSTTSGSGYVQVYSGSALTFTDKLASAGVYYYVLTVSDGVVTSGYSNEVAVTVNAPIAASLTADAVTIYAGTSTTLRWASTVATAATVNGTGVSTTGTQAVSPTTTTAYILSLTAPNCATVTRTVTVTVLPLPAPTVLTASPTCAGVALTWIPPPVYTSFAILRDGVQVGTSSTPVYVDTPPAPWVDHSYTVETVNGAVSSAAGAAAVAQMPAAVAQATGMTLSAGPGTIIASWVAVPHASTYNLYRNGLLAASTPGLSIVDAVTSDQAYTYTVAGVGPCGVGPQSAASTATALPAAKASTNTTAAASTASNVPAPPSASTNSPTPGSAWTNAPKLPNNWN